MSRTVAARLAALCIAPIASGCMDAKRGGSAGDAGDTLDVAAHDSTDAVDTSPLGDTVSDAADASPLDDTAADTTDSSTVEDTGDADATLRTCACDHGQECAAPCPDVGQVCARDGYPDASAIRYCRPAALAGEGCSNQFNEYYIPCAPGLSCLARDPGDDDTVRQCFDCAPQDAVGVGACEMELGVFFDGSFCVSLSGCSCDGADCDSPYPSLEACEAAVRRPCAGQ